MVPNTEETESRGKEIGRRSEVEAVVTDGRWKGRPEQWSRFFQQGEKALVPV